MSAWRQMALLLSVCGVTAFYGKIQALRGVDIEVKEGEIVTLIGANGAGKSTLMMTICGTPRARDGVNPLSMAGTLPQCRPTTSCASALPRRRRAGGFSRA